MESIVIEKKVVKGLIVNHSFTVFPDDLNYFGTLFGGKVLAEMDIAAGKAMRRLLYNTLCEGGVTASLDKVDFKVPAFMGDIIEMTAEVISLGRTSVLIEVIVTKEDHIGNVDVICDAHFTFVSVRDKKPHPHNCVLLKDIPALIEA